MRTGPFSNLRSHRSRAHRRKRFRVCRDTPRRFPASAGRQRSSRSTAITCAHLPPAMRASARRGRVRLHRSLIVSNGPAARAILRVRLRSSRKFWPSDFFAARPCARSPRASGGKISLRHRPFSRRVRWPRSCCADRLCHARRCRARCRDRARCARSAVPASRSRLPRRTSVLIGIKRLVVIHAERGVVARARFGVEHRVGGERPGDHMALHAQRVRRRAR